MTFRPWEDSPRNLPQVQQAGYETDDAKKQDSAVISGTGDDLPVDQQKAGSKIFMPFLLSQKQMCTDVSVAVAL
jgi:hypothetical protein